MKTQSKSIRAWRLKSVIIGQMLKVSRDMVKNGGRSEKTDQRLAARHDTLQKRKEIVERYLFIS